MPNTNAFYEVKLQGRYEGQDIVNILFYRLGFDIIPGDFNLAGADTLANLVKDNVWTPTLKPYMLTGYLLDKIVVTPRDADFNPLYQLPYVKEVGEYGGTAGNSNGPATCLIARCNLNPTNLTQGFFPPKRGYLAIGPLADNVITNTGDIEAGNYAGWVTAVQKFAQTLTSILPPATFHPIRLRVTRTLGGLVTLNGWADIASMSVNHKASFRRSRVGEA